MKFHYDRLRKSAPLQDFIQLFSLRNRPRKPVEDESALRIRPRQPFFYHPEHDVVWNELAAFHDGLG